MKKAIALVCALAMLMAWAMPALGEEAARTLEEITLRVKQTLDISDDYADFTSDSYDGNWNLNWSGGGMNVYVTCSSEGEILSYNRYDGSYDYYYSNIYAPRFPTAGAQGVREAADEFLARVVGGGKGWRLDAISESLENDNSRSAYVSGRITMGDYPTDITFSVTVDFEDMSVTNYYRSDSYMRFEDQEFDKAVNVTEEQARALLREKGGLSLKYYIANEGDMAKLVYIRDYNGTFIVRAADGEVVDLDAAYNTGAEGESFSAMGGYDDGVMDAQRQLTEAELKSISAHKQALPADELDRLARAFEEFGLTDEYLLTSVDFYNSSSGLMSSLAYARKIPDGELSSRYGMSEDAIASIAKGRGYYDTKTVTLVASTGALESYYTGRPYIFGAYRAEVDAQEHRETADAFIKKYFPELFDSIELTTKGSGAIPYGYAPPVANYYYVRTHAGYQFDGNNVSVSVNAEDGIIDSFYKYWNDGQEFEEVDAGALISENAAYEAYAAAMPFELVLVSVPGLDGTYGYNYRYTRTLAWRYLDNYDVYGVDAATGEVLRYNNGYGAIPGSLAYSDINGVPAEAAIEALGRYGIGFPGGAFEPEKAFTLRDMLSFIVAAGGYTNAAEMEYADICSYAAGLGAPDFSKQDPESPVTRAQFAGLIVDMYGLGDVADFEGIFSCGFADDAEVADYGRVALAYGMGLIAPDAENKINAAAELTRADGAQILYNFLNRSF